MFANIRILLTLLGVICVKISKKGEHSILSNSLLPVEELAPNSEFSITHLTLVGITREIGSYIEREWHVRGKAYHPTIQTYPQSNIPGMDVLIKLQVSRRSTVFQEFLKK